MAGSGENETTYSIVARDPKTGQFGVAVQSHWFSVGGLVGWAESGVGAVATQSFVEPAYGARGIALMQSGLSAHDALHSLASVDEQVDVRQVAMVDTSGGVAVHTGDRCIPEAGHATGDGFSAQANIMARPTVWEAMAETYASSDGDLADRLLASLDAAEREGGDLRGRQSAAILVVAGTPSGHSWKDRELDLRVEDHPAPVDELRRLVNLWRAYELAERAEEHDVLGERDAAFAEQRAALELEPTNPEICFWTAISLAQAGRVEEARSTIAVSFAADMGWAELLRRLVKAERPALEPSILDALLAAE